MSTVPGMFLWWHVFLVVRAAQQVLQMFTLNSTSCIPWALHLMYVLRRTRKSARLLQPGHSATANSML